MVRKAIEEFSVCSLKVRASSVQGFTASELHDENRRVGLLDPGRE